MSIYLLFSIAAAVVAIIAGGVLSAWVIGRKAGNEKMQEIASAIQKGSKAYLNRQYRTIGVVASRWMVTRHPFLNNTGSS